MKDKYIPNPPDLSDVELPQEVASLIEAMAKNVHEVWAQNRIEEGWTYGEKRDDVLKQTPCLVPYEQLPEIEKAYDRNTAITTLKLILKSGFEIKYKK